MTRRRSPHRFTSSFVQPLVIPFRLSVCDTLKRAGFASLADARAEGSLFTSATVPACCTEGCMVAPEDHCTHGQPSVLTATK